MALKALSAVSVSKRVVSAVEYFHFPQCISGSVHGQLLEESTASAAVSSCISRVSTALRHGFHLHFCKPEPYFDLDRPPIYRMPASREFLLHDKNNDPVLRLSLEAVDHTDEVFYTDTAPTFLATIENLTDKPLTGSMNCFLGFGTAAGEGRRMDEINVDVEANGKRTDLLEFDELLYQDNVLIGIVTNIDQRNMVDRRDDEICISSPGPMSGSIYALYSFHAWERNYYQLNQKTPRESQIWSKRLVAGVLLLAVVQIGIELL
jgi:hypothetical protein